MDQLANDTPAENGNLDLLIESYYGEDAPAAALHIASLLTEFAAYGLAQKQTPDLTANLVMISASLMKASQTEDTAPEEMSLFLRGVLETQYLTQPPK